MRTAIEAELRAEHAEYLAAVELEAAEEAAPAEDEDSAENGYAEKRARKEKRNAALRMKKEKVQQLIEAEYYVGKDTEYLTEYLSRIEDGLAHGLAEMQLMH